VGKRNLKSIRLASDCLTEDQEPTQSAWPENRSLFLTERTIELSHSRLIDVIALCHMHLKHIYEFLYVIESTAPWYKM
jgi:hypothetical protein